MFKAAVASPLAVFIVRTSDPSGEMTSDLTAPIASPMFISGSTAVAPVLPTIPKTEANSEPISAVAILILISPIAA